MQKKSGERNFPQLAGGSFVALCLSVIGRAAVPGICDEMVGVFPAVGYRVTMTRRPLML